MINRNYISLFIIALLLAFSPMINQLNISQRASVNNMSCCQSEMQNTLVASELDSCPMSSHEMHNDMAESNADSKDSQDCQHDCSGNNCHSIVPASFVMNLVRIYQPENLNLYNLETSHIATSKEQLLIDDFLHAIWHPPKV